MNISNIFDPCKLPPLQNLIVSSWKRQSEQILVELQMGVNLDLAFASLINLFNLSAFLATDPEP